MSECNHNHPIRLEGIDSRYQCPDCKEIIVARWRPYTIGVEFGPMPATPPTPQVAERELSDEVKKHRAEYPKEASDRYFPRKATAEDLIALVLWEVLDCEYSLPPEAEQNGIGVQNYHAGCAAWRAYSYMSQLKDKIARLVTETQN